ncbi:MAG TPA: hypothetical protein VFE62_12305 [Gemmataceae bacterium]|nr:hypothetical protein [Pirellulales bacterium]HZZ79295.1 hypothetical protein [Gemmataceae bacterium]
MSEFEDQVRKALDDQSRAADELAKKRKEEHEAKQKKTAEAKVFVNELRQRVAQPIAEDVMRGAGWDVCPLIVENEPTSQTWMFGGKILGGYSEIRILVQYGTKGEFSVTVSANYNQLQKRGFILDRSLDSEFSEWLKVQLLAAIKYLSQPK